MSKRAPYGPHDVATWRNRHLTPTGKPRAPWIRQRPPAAAFAELRTDAGTATVATDGWILVTLAGATVDVRDEPAPGVLPHPAWLPILVGNVGNARHAIPAGLVASLLGPALLARRNPPPAAPRFLRPYGAILRHLAAAGATAHRVDGLPSHVAFCLPSGDLAAVLVTVRPDSPQGRRSVDLAGVPRDDCPV